MAAGWPGHAQNVENAGCLPRHVPQRKQMPGGGQKQAGCPGPPPHTCCPLSRGQTLAWTGRVGTLVLHRTPVEFLPSLTPQRQKPPRDLSPFQGLREAFRRTKESKSAGLKVEGSWDAQSGCCQEAQL